MSLRLAAIIAVASVVMAMGGIAWIQTQRLESAERQLRETREILDATRKAVAALEAEKIESDRRKTAAAAAREAVRDASVDDEPPIAPSVWAALEAANEIGGLK